jgi:hypothetical protein
MRQDLKAEFSENPVEPDRTIATPMFENRQKRLAQQIVDRSAMARGVVVLDETVAGLASALREANIKVVELPAGTADAVMRQAYLFHRILVTSNTKEFLEEAPIHEYGIVSLEKLTFIDPSPSFATNITAQMISQAISAYGLWTKGAKFLLELRDDGQHELTPLE